MSSSSLHQIFPNYVHRLLNTYFVNVHGFLRSLECPILLHERSFVSVCDPVSTSFTNERSYIVPIISLTNDRS